MKVSQVIELLSKCNPDAVVIAYSSDTEDASMVGDVKENSEPYCKGATCKELAGDRPYVVIG